MTAPVTPDPTPGEVGLTAEDMVALSDAIGAELYASLMESTADQWRRWEFMTAAAKDAYRLEGARIVAEAVSPAVERILAARTAALQAEADEWKRQADINLYRKRAQAAEAEVADLRTKVERVEALADAWDAEYHMKVRFPPSYAADLRAARGGEHDA